MHAFGEIGGAALIAVIVEEHHDVSPAELDHRAEVATAGIGEQPHAWTQLFEMEGQMHGQQVRELPAVQVKRAAGVGQQCYGSLERGGGQLRQCPGGPVVLRMRLV